MYPLVYRPRSGCLGIVIEVLLLCVVFGVTDKLFADAGANGVVLLAFIARWIYASVTSPAAAPGRTDSGSGYLLVNAFEDRRDDAEADAAEAGSGSDAGGDTSSD